MNLANINTFAEGVSLKRGCGCECSHLQCKMSVCDRAQLMADGHLNFLLHNKKQVKALINVGMWWEALEIAYELLDGGHVTEERFEAFRINHFSCSLR